ncbi:MAG: LTA synthase family protein [Eubacteriales bacterium]|nr:LTA synthase family protein [Eubacteriales bacterium]
MKIKFAPTKATWIWTVLMAILALVMWNITRYHILVLFGFVGMFFLITSIKLELKKEIPWIWTGILYILGPIYTYLCMQAVILAPNYFVKTERQVAIYNILLIMVIYFLIMAVMNRPVISAIVAHVILTFGAYCNYFVYTCRENEITFADMAALRTGLSVARNYRFQLHDRGAYIIMLTILLIVALWSCEVKFEKRIPHRIIALVISIGILFWLSGKTEKMETQTWLQKGSWQNGFALNFALSVRDNFVSPPEGYSTDAVKRLEEKYENANGTQNVEANKKVKDPTVIMIMDESLADLSVLGNLVTNEEVLPFISSMRENTVKGYALASVYGAKTPNSEWEFLTGNSMALLPSGSVVYEQYMKKEPTSMVSTLKNEGYTAVAMHPYLASGWRRNTIYPSYGFDEQYFLDDPYGFFDADNTIRKYVSDRELFWKMIERFEKKGDDEKLFLMGITMQNHGGYKDDYPGFQETIVASPGTFKDANQYLTVAHETDNAVKDLIHYFQNVDEPVVIVLFGDHQPSLNNNFYKTLNGSGMSGLTMDELEDFFKVPFFIWTNYDTPATEIECTSLNYLSTLTLERAGIELPAYNKFLSDMMTVIPSINARGYYSESKGRYLHIEDAVGEEAEWIRSYQMLQYNNMFDKKNKSKLFFPYLTDQKKTDFFIPLLGKEE